jgi:hypothetical protein
MELLLRQRHVLQPELHLHVLEARILGTRRESLRLPGGLRDAAVPLRAVCAADIADC